MALCIGDFVLWPLLKQRGLVPPDPALVEMGEANWYGDVPLDALSDLLGYPSPECPFDQAKAFYRHCTGYRSYAAIDLYGRDCCLKYDLNEPLPEPLRADVVANSGTAEHVFDTRRFWQTCHEVCTPGGLMVHNVPFTGWFDHGFVSYQPTFLFDLAWANGYEFLTLLYLVLRRRLVKACSLEWLHEQAREGKLDANAMLMVAWRKADDRPFVAPQQGVYAGRRDAAAVKDWEDLR